MSQLRIVLKNEEYERVLSGEQKQVYREVKPYWNERMVGQQVREVVLQKGCSKEHAAFRVISIRIGIGNPEWGAPAGEKVFIILLGGKL